MHQPPYVRLANEIAAQFHLVSPDAGAAQVGNHIQRFWDPRMRRQLFAHIEAGGSDLDPLVVDAADQIRVA